MSDEEPPQEQAADPLFSAALARGLSIIQCFSVVDRELTSRQLVERTGLSRQTVFRITNTLKQQGLLRYSAARGTFLLAPRFLAITASILSGLSIRQIARPLMQELADYAGGQVALAMGDDLNLVVIELAQGASSAVYRLEIGSRMSLSRSAPGISYLSCLSSELQERHLHNLNKDLAGHSQLRERLEAAKQALRTRGYFVLKNDIRPDTVGVAAPVRVREDGQLFVFSCAILPIGDDERRLHEIGVRLLNLVGAVAGPSADLGEI